MAEILKVQVEDEKGNIYYLHTDAGVVFCADGESVESKLKNKIDKANIVNNAQTTLGGFALDARMGKTLGDQIAQLNSHLVVGKNGLLNSAQFWRTKDSCDIDFECSDGVLRQIIYNTTENSLVGSVGGIAKLFIILRDITGIDCIYDPGINAVVFKWCITPTHHRQLVLLDNGINYDLWDGQQWQNIWHMNVN